MKRDLNLVREILLTLEPLNVHYGKPIILVVGMMPLQFAEITDDQIDYHLRIMTDGGLLNTGPISDTKQMAFYGLTWKGHEFVDDIRNPDAWADTMGKMKKYGGFGLDVAWQLAKAYMKAHGLPF